MGLVSLSNRANGDSATDHLEEIERGTAWRAGYERCDEPFREVAGCANGRHPKAPAPREEDRAEEHRDQYGEVTARYRRVLARPVSTLLRRGVMRSYRGRMGFVDLVDGRYVPDLVRVAEDAVAEQQRRGEEDREPAGYRVGEDDLSYTVRV